MIKFVCYNFGQGNPYYFQHIMLGIKLLRIYRRFSNKSNLQAELKKFEELQRMHRLQQIFHMESSKKLVSQNDLRESYRKLLQKYHSDIHRDEGTSIIYDKITKIITRAYRQIDKNKFTKDQSSKRDSARSTYLQDEVCFELFGKNYEEAKYSMYKKGNQHMKNKFFQKMYARTGDSQYRYNESARYSTDYVYEQAQASKSNAEINTKQQKGGDYTFPLIGLGLLALTIGYWMSKQTKKKVQVRQIRQTLPPPSPQIVKLIQSSSKPKQPKKKTLQQKYQYLIDTNYLAKQVVKDHPPALHIPHGHQPSLIEQLTQYSIAPDIHLYEVEPKWYTEDKQQQLIQKGQFDMQKAFPLNKIKMNTVLTLSLEAERALQNIYVKVKDLIAQIKETGKYTPPKVFIKFHGYILFQLRDKPITLVNYRDTDYVSLFDLYFENYSALFLKRDYYMQYLVEKDNKELFGYVYLNHRKCKSVYLNKGQKIAFFHQIKFKRESKVLTYQVIWNDYYRRFYSFWQTDPYYKKQKV